MTGNDEAASKGAGNGVGEEERNSKEEYEDVIKKMSLAQRVFFFFLPFIISAFYFFFLYNGLGYYYGEDGRTIALIIGAGMISTLFILGPEISITSIYIALIPYVPGLWESLGWMLLVSMSIAYVDVIGAFFLLWNYDLVKMIPLLGPWMDRTEDANRGNIKKTPWRQRFAMIGISVYVMFPVHGSGGLVGTIIGRILGIGRWKVFASVSIGAIVGALWIGALVKSVGPSIEEWFEGEAFKLVGYIITLALVILLASFIWSSYKKRKERKKNSNVSSNKGEASEQGEVNNAELEAMPKQVSGSARKGEDK